jgi:hypothetical protein
VLRLPLPVAGRREPRAIGAAIAVGGVLFSLSGMLTVLRYGTTVCTGGPLGRPPVASSAMSPHPETEINNGGEDHHGER